MMYDSKLNPSCITLEAGDYYTPCNSLCEQVHPVRNRVATEVFEWSSYCQGCLDAMLRAVKSVKSAETRDRDRDSTYNMLKANVDSIAAEINQYGAGCFDENRPEKAAHIWREAAGEDAQLIFDEYGTEAECLECDVLIKLTEDYDAVTNDSAKPCEDLAVILAQIEATLDAYMETYGIWWTMDGDGDIIGVRVTVAGGGPNIFINTLNNKVEGYWGFSTEYSHEIQKDQAEAITDHFAELAPTRS